MMTETEVDNKKNL